MDCRRTPSRDRLLMSSEPGYDELVAAALAAPVRGWDFGWLAGRAVGSDPTWSYPQLARDAIDVGAVIHQLRMVPWQVPDFTVHRYDTALRRIDARIGADGPFRVHCHRFLLAATRTPTGRSGPAASSAGRG